MAVNKDDPEMPSVERGSAGGPDYRTRNVLSRDILEVALLFILHHANEFKGYIIPLKSLGTA